MSVTCTVSVTVCGPAEVSIVDGVIVIDSRRGGVVSLRAYQPVTSTTTSVSPELL
jgi:hypothetical protein